MSKIADEKKLSEKYYFVMDKENPDLLKLSKENVALAEFLVRNDSAYTKTSIKTAVSTAKYHGSTAYWFSRLNEFCQSNQGDYAEIIFGCIIAVDNENGTHLNADHIGREVLKNRIVEWGQENLLKSLKERDFALVKKLAERTGTQKGARCNPSFASKFCHFACKNMFEGEDAEDNFSIYDSVLCGVLPAYASHYGVEVKSKKQLENYEVYSQKIDEIISKSGGAISRNGFDHLLWYYHKAHPINK